MNSEVLKVVLFSVLGFVVAAKLLLVFGALRGYSGENEAGKIKKGVKDAG